MSIYFVLIFLFQGFSWTIYKFLQVFNSIKGHSRMRDGKDHRRRKRGGGGGGGGGGGQG